MRRSKKHIKLRILFDLTSNVFGENSKKFMAEDE